MINSTLCITNYRNRIISWLDVNNKIEQISVTDSQTDIVNNIYIGRVKHIVKNINAFFVEFQPGVLGFLSKNDILSDIKLREGDCVPVMVVKEASKNKEAVLTTKLSLTGHYSIVELGGNDINVSRKISGEKRHELKSAFKNNRFNIIIRTNAAALSDFSILQNEVNNLSDKLDEIIERSQTREALYLLYKSEPEYLRFVKSIPLNSYERILTDIASIYSELSTYGCELYKDNYELTKLYSLDTKLNEILSKKIWLKSGSNIVIEHTEALSVIDVNSGKNLSKREQEDNILILNKEAAKEISRQIRLRNISGIIIIDFINMTSEENKNELILYIKELLKEDYVRCDFVDITKLGLIELVRKKIKPPIYELFD